jgi:hypothetical protein
MNVISARQGKKKVLDSQKKKKKLGWLIRPRFKTTVKKSEGTLYKGSGTDRQ